MIEVKCTSLHTKKTYFFLDFNYLFSLSFSFLVEKIVLLTAFLMSCIGIPFIKRKGLILAKTENTVGCS